METPTPKGAGVVPRVPWKVKCHGDTMEVPKGVRGELIRVLRGIT